MGTDTVCRLGMEPRCICGLGVGKSLRHVLVTQAKRHCGKTTGCCMLAYLKVSYLGAKSRDVLGVCLIGLSCQPGQ